MRTPGTTLATLLCLLIGAAACADKAGDTCSVGKHVCADAKTLLACNTGRYVAVSCKGPDGCFSAGPDVGAVCDFSQNEPGGPCADTDRDRGRCAGKTKGMLKCRNGKLVAEPCRGPAGCVDTEVGARCDQDYAMEGDYCGPAQDNNHACEAGGTRMLVCKAGKYIEKSRCDRCDVELHRVVCHH